MNLWNESFINLIRREIDRLLSERRRPNRTGLVTSYDPVTHTAKVMFQPEGKLSGDLPILCHHVGAGYGILVGLTPGDGKTTGDLVEVSFQEGDRESGRIIGRLHNVTDTPPQVQSGEVLVQHENGNYTYFKADGSLTHLHGKSGNYMKLDKNGNISGYIKDNTKTQHYVGGDPTVSGTFSPISTTAGPSPFSQARVS